MPTAENMPSSFAIFVKVLLASSNVVQMAVWLKYSRYFWASIVYIVTSGKPPSSLFEQEVFSKKTLCLSSLQAYEKYWLWDTCWNLQLCEFDGLLKYP